MSSKINCKICLEEGRDHRKGNRPNRETRLFRTATLWMYLCAGHADALEKRIKERRKERGP